jgi:hypothetical protein
MYVAGIVAVESGQVDQVFTVVASNDPVRRP